MIYMISDLHGNKFFKGLQDYIQIAKETDVLIILGDVGLQFENTEENRRFTEYFLSLEKNIAFLDGNHENFSFLQSFPSENWNGGKVHRLSPYIVHLQRGNVYEIEGQKFFVFGGCKSSPIWKERGLWSSKEEGNGEEFSLAYENLVKNGYAVDYVLTHKYENDYSAPYLSQPLFELTLYVEQNVSYKRWYAGHWHVNKKLDEKHVFVYNELILLE